MQQIVCLQEAINRAKHHPKQHDVKRIRPPFGQQGVDAAPGNQNVDTYQIPSLGHMPTVHYTSTVIRPMCLCKSTPVPKPAVFCSDNASVELFKHFSLYSPASGPVMCNYSRVQFCCYISATLINGQHSRIVYRNRNLENSTQCVPFCLWIKCIFSSLVLGELDNTSWFVKAELK